MKKKWSKERKWETNKAEEEFDRLLAENGFTIAGIKEYNEKTDYLIEKDGVQCEFSMWHIDNSKSRAELCFKNFMEYYKIKVEYEKLKKRIEEED